MIKRCLQRCRLFVPDHHYVIYITIRYTDYQTCPGDLFRKNVLDKNILSANITEAVCLWETRSG
jgi:hypothetical protein